MKVIIAGSRSITDYKYIKRLIRSSCFYITEIVSGNAAGVDTLGERYAAEYNIPIKFFPADWKKYGKIAGPFRNCQMACYAEALIAFPCHCSKGTKHMLSIAQQKNLHIYTRTITCDKCKKIKKGN